MMNPTKMGQWAYNKTNRQYWTSNYLGHDFVLLPFRYVGLAIKKLKDPENAILLRFKTFSVIENIPPEGTDAMDIKLNRFAAYNLTNRPPSYFKKGGAKINENRMVDLDQSKVKQRMKVYESKDTERKKLLKERFLLGMQKLLAKKNQ